MTEPVKFTFDQAFDGGAKSRYDLELERIQQESIRSQQEMHVKGQEAGRQEALEGIEAATNTAMDQLVQSAQQLFQQEHHLRSSMKQEMVQLAYAIASKLSPALLQQHPLAEIEALIEDCMATAFKEPRLVVRVAESITESIGGHIDKMKAATNFQGDVVLIGEAGLGPHDCRVEWPDGGTERNQADIQREIENAVQRFVMSETENAMAENSQEQQDTLPDDANISSDAESGQ